MSYLTIPTLFPCFKLSTQNLQVITEDNKIEVSQVLFLSLHSLYYHCSWQINCVCAGICVAHLAERLPPIRNLL